jgi:hypothetical protein
MTNNPMINDVTNHQTNDTITQSTSTPTTVLISSRNSYGPSAVHPATPKPHSPNPSSSSSLASSYVFPSIKPAVNTNAAKSGPPSAIAATPVVRPFPNASSVSVASSQEGQQSHQLSSLLGPSLTIDVTLPRQHHITNKLIPLGFGIVPSTYTTTIDTHPHHLHTDKVAVIASSASILSIHDGGSKSSPSITSITPLLHHDAHDHINDGLAPIHGYAIDGAATSGHNRSSRVMSNMSNMISMTNGIPLLSSSSSPSLSPISLSLPSTSDDLLMRISHERERSMIINIEDKKRTEEERRLLASLRRQLKRDQRTLEHDKLEAEDERANDIRRRNADKARRDDEVC